MGSSKNEWERHLKLYNSITDMVTGGARTIEWVNERFQWIVDAPRPLFASPGLTGSEREECVSRWGKVLPGKSSEITDLAAAFCAPFNMCPLELPVSGLRKKAVKEFFWAHVQDVHIIHPTDSLPFPRMNHLGRSLRNEFDIDLNDQLGPLRRDAVARVFDAQFPSFSKCFGPYDTLGLVHGLKATLWFAIGYLGVGDTSKNFHPLLQRWHSGNYPVGLAFDNVAVYLCK